MSIQKGEFNSMLKKTGFLAQPKMEARLISRHPHRFLEHYADRKIGVLNSENDALKSFIHDVKQAGDYDRKAMILCQKKHEVKNRSFLLNLASSPAIGSEFMKDFQMDSLRSSSRISIDGKSQESVDYEAIIDNYLTEIKMADKEDIENWIATYTSVRDMKLPYGLPENLRMPLDPRNIEDEALIDFIESSNDEFLILDGEYHTKIEEICKKLSENHKSLTQTSKWTIAESALLYYIITSIEESQSPNPATVSLQKDLTKRIFRNKTREEVISQKYLLKLKRVLEERRGNVIRDWMRDKKELQDKINSAWEALHKERVKKLEKSIKLRKQKQVCKEWGTLLKKMRQAKSEKVRNIQIMIEPIAKKMEEKEKHKLEKEFERKKVVKSAAEKYREKKMMDRTMIQSEKGSMQKIMEEMRKREIELHRNRVEFRKQEYDNKCQIRKEMEANLEEEKRRKMAILERTKEKVDVEVDSERVVADTHASMVRRYEIMNEKRRESSEEDMVKFFRQQYSFTAETVWTDRRVRLEAKLREAGLLHSSYARQILKAMQPKEKPHLATNIKFEPDE